MKLADELLNFRAANGCESRCRVRAFLPEDDGGAAAYVVLATDDANARGASVTNAAETIAAAACRRWNIPAERLIFMEHYDYRWREGGTDMAGRTESFDQVLFAGTTASSSPCKQVPSLSTPTWKRTDKASVEALIGEALP